MKLLGHFNFFFFFSQKDFECTKSTKNQKNTKKHKIATKQKHKNANKQTKIKNVLKKHLRGEKVTYSRFCVCEETKKSLCNGNVGPTKLVKVLFALYELKLVY